MIEWVTASIERSPRYWLAAVLALYFAGTLAKSHQKPLWYDEIFSDSISRASGLQQMLIDVRSDGQPPLNPMMIQWSHRLLGYGDFATRVPAVLGMGVLCICLYVFVRRRCGPVWGLCAMTLPLASAAYWYATEARAYGPLLGFTGLALLCWDNAVEGRRRRLALVGLALSIATALCCHYYAVQIAFALSVAEAVRTVVRRKLDLAIWAALAIGAAPLIVLIPLARETSANLFTSIQAGPRFAFRPHLSDALLWFPTLIAPAILPLVAAIAIYAVMRRFEAPDRAVTPVRVVRVFDVRGRFAEPWEFGVLAGFLLLPLMMVVGTKLTTDNFMWRHALPALVGAVLLMVYGVRWAVKGSTAVAVLWLAANSCLVAGKAARNVLIKPEPVGLSAAMPGFPASDTLPIVVANALTFLQVLRYSPPDVVPRLHYLANREAVLKLPDFIPEIGLVMARDWAHFPVEDYSEFNKREHSYWIYSTNNPDLEWLPELRAPHGANSFLLVTR